MAVAEGGGGWNVLPKTSDAIYFGFCALWAATLVEAVVGETQPSDGATVAMVGSVAPLVAALAMNALSGDRVSPLWPFHKDSIGNVVVHLVVGAWMSAAPVYATLAPLLVAPAPRE